MVLYLSVQNTVIHPICLKKCFWKLTLSRLASSENCKYHSFWKHLFTKIFIPLNYKEVHEKHTWHVSYHQVGATGIKWKQAFHQCFVFTQMLQFKGILPQACIQRAAEFLDQFIHCFWAGGMWCYLGDCSHYPCFSFRSNKSLLQQTVQLCQNNFWINICNKTEIFSQHLVTNNRQNMHLEHCFQFWN